MSIYPTHNYFDKCFHSFDKRIIFIFASKRNIKMGIADILFQRNKEKAEKNLKEGQEFLEQNKSKEGVVCLPSGLQYKVLVPAEGEKRATAISSVTCHYEGKLLNGKIFDSSKKRGAPLTFPLNRVIAGWTEGLQLMPIGSTYEFYIPAHLAYGDRQVGSDIPPNSTLIFEVELLNIQ